MEEMDVLEDVVCVVGGEKSSVLCVMRTDIRDLVPRNGLGFQRHADQAEGASVFPAGPAASAAWEPCSKGRRDD